MEEIKQSRSPTATLARTAKQPRPFVLALLLTGILYLGLTLPRLEIGGFYRTRILYILREQV